MLPTYATEDISLPETPLSEMSSLDIEALRRILSARQKVVDVYVEGDWFPHIVEEARRKVRDIENLIAAKELEKCDTTLGYYDANASAYAELTAQAAISPVRDIFVSMLKPGSLVVDAGCGSGRDIPAFLAEGFDVFAFDGSAELADIARKATGHSVQHLRFDQYRYPYPDFHCDAVWAAASLLHVPRSGLLSIVKRLSAPLRDGGLFYASFKLGTGERIREDGRLETLLTHQETVRLFAGAGLSALRLWQNKSVLPGGADIWLNIIGTKIG